jgi:hypothetical protein
MTNLENPTSKTEIGVDATVERLFGLLDPYLHSDEVDSLGKQKLNEFQVQFERFEIANNNNGEIKDKLATKLAGALAGLYSQQKLLDTGRSNEITAKLFIMNIMDERIGNSALIHAIKIVLKYEHNIELRDIFQRTFDVFAVAFGITPIKLSSKRQSTGKK